MLKVCAANCINFKKSEVYATNSKNFLTPVPPKAPRLYTS